jgi:acyl-coenzyme A synthetase/AMP-(fatty) acid ligase
VFDLHPDTGVYCCTTDVSWVTGRSYATYAPLINRGDLGVRNLLAVLQGRMTAS